MRTTCWCSGAWPPAPAASGCSPTTSAARRPRRAQALAAIDTSPVGFAVFDRVLLTVHPTDCHGARVLRRAAAAARPRGATAAAQRAHADQPGRPDAAHGQPHGRQLPRAAPPADAAARLPAGASCSTRAPLRRLAACCSTRATRCTCSKTPAKTSARRSPNGSTRSTNGRRADDAAAQRERELLRVRSRDVLEHIERVLAHVRRLESSAETAVQMHFSAQSNRTNDIMRTLTVLTAIFLPLNLVTGFFGMNFEGLPLIHSADRRLGRVRRHARARHRPERLLLAQALPGATLNASTDRFAARASSALLALLTLVWGLNWPVMKLGVTGFPPLGFRAHLDVARPAGALGACCAVQRVPFAIAPRRLARARQALAHQHDRLARRSRSWRCRRCRRGGRRSSATRCRSSRRSGASPLFGERLRPRHSPASPPPALGVALLLWHEFGAWPAGRWRRARHAGRGRGLGARHAADAAHDDRRRRRWRSSSG